VLCVLECGRGRTSCGILAEPPSFRPHTAELVKSPRGTCRPTAHGGLYRKSDLSTLPVGRRIDALIPPTNIAAAHYIRLTPYTEEQAGWPQLVLCESTVWYDIHIITYTQVRTCCATKSVALSLVEFYS
jgi:hypothetical protein